jgi:hypothetical protein
VFNHSHNLITNEAALLEDPTNIAQALKTSQSTDPFVMCVGPLWPLMPGEESDHIADLTPDKSFAEHVITGQKAIREFDIYFVMADSSQYDISLLVFCLLLPDDLEEDFRFEFTFFALTKLGKSALLLDQLTDMMERELPNTRNDSTA